MLYRCEQRMQRPWGEEGVGHRRGGCTGNECSSQGQSVDPVMVPAAVIVPGPSPLLYPPHGDIFSLGAL